MAAVQERRGRVAETSPASMSKRCAAGCGSVDEGSRGGKMGSRNGIRVRATMCALPTISAWRVHEQESSKRPQEVAI